MKRAYSILALMPKPNDNYDKTIDTIRSFAFLLVFTTHYARGGGLNIQLHTGQWWDNNLISSLAIFGAEGVTLFFSLTGFLLGRILIKEFNKKGKISFKNFMYRRILRIWPLYILFILITLFLNNFSDTPTITPGELPFLLTFTYNWGLMYSGIQGSMLNHTWSISIEEQIYLFFPMCMFFFRRNRFLQAAGFFVFFGLIIQLIYSHFYSVWLYRSTFIYFSVVGIGVLSAIYEPSLKSVKKYNILILLILILAIIFYIHSFTTIINSSKFGEYAVFYLTASFVPMLLFILTQINLRVGTSWLYIFSFIGRRSYGCYLYHLMIWRVLVGREIFFSHEKGFSLIGVSIALMVTILISSLSYKYFEMPFLNKRKKYQIDGSA